MSRSAGDKVFVGAVGGVWMPAHVIPDILAAVPRIDSIIPIADLCQLILSPFAIMAEIKFPWLVDIAIVEVKVILLEECAAIIARISDLWDEATNI